MSTWAHVALAGLNVVQVCVLALIKAQVRCVEEEQHRARARRRAEDPPEG